MEERRYIFLTGKNENQKGIIVFDEKQCFFTGTELEINILYSLFGLDRQNKILFREDFSFSKKDCQERELFLFTESFAYCLMNAKLKKGILFSEKWCTKVHRPIVWQALEKNTKENKKDRMKSTEQCIKEKVMPAATYRNPNSRRAPVDRLEEFCFPNAISFLREYFQKGKPAALDAAAGWRFVLVPVQGIDFSDHCFLGCFKGQNSVLQIAYILEDHPKTGKIENYIYQENSKGKGMWVFTQSLHV